MAQNTKGERVRKITVKMPNNTSEHMAKNA
jgi:hypothetical protein